MDREMTEEERREHKIFLWERAFYRFYMVISLLLLWFVAVIVFSFAKKEIRDYTWDMQRKDIQARQPQKETFPEDIQLKDEYEYDEERDKRNTQPLPDFIIEDIKPNELEQLKQ